MTTKATIKKLEDRYHVHIDHHREWNGEVFHIYSADGCHWDACGSYRSLIKTLAEDKTSLNRLYNLERLAQAEKATEYAW